MGPVWVDRTSAVFFCQPQPADSGPTRALFAFLEGTPAGGGWRSWRSWRSASKFGRRPTTLPSMSVIHSPADRGPTDPLLISVCSELHTYPAVPKERLYPDRRRAQRIRPWKKSRLSTHRGGSGNVRWPVSRALCWGGAAAHVVPHSPFGRLGESGKQSSWEHCTHERGVVAHLYLQTSVIAEAVLGSLLARPLPRGWRPSGGALQDAKDSRSHSPDAFAPC